MPAWDEVVKVPLERILQDSDHSKEWLRRTVLYHRSYPVQFDGMGNPWTFWTNVMNHAKDLIEQNSNNFFGAVNLLLQEQHQQYLNHCNGAPKDKRMHDLMKHKILGNLGVLLYLSRRIEIEGPSEECKQIVQSMNDSEVYDKATLREIYRGFEFL